MTNRQLAALETKQKLMDAAKKIICEKGLVNTSISEITKAAGVSNGSFYTYFPRKEDVMYSISKEMFQEIFDQASGFQGDFISRLSFFLTSAAGYIEKSSLKLCQEWVRNTVDPDLVDDEYNRTKMATDKEFIRKLIEAGIKSGELDENTPSEILAHTFTDVLYGEMLCWDMSGGAYSFKERTEEFCSIFLPLLIKPYQCDKEER